MKKFSEYQLEFRSKLGDAEQINRNKMKAVFTDGIVEGIIQAVMVITDPALLGSSVRARLHDYVFYDVAAVDSYMNQNRDRFVSLRTNLINILITDITPETFAAHAEQTRLRAIASKRYLPSKKHQRENGETPTPLKTIGKVRSRRVDVNDPPQTE